ncbi:MAG: phosphoglucosamine mutase [Candidatus Falkowbacteria bacterium]|nr:MAG: phosphoglucosamine mutase [Candidatus Falkowbacteria bacterium]
MSIIKSISGIRGTIGGEPGNNLTPVEIIKFSSAFGAFIIKRNPSIKTKIIVGRDARVSGEMVSRLVVGNLLSLGIDIIDLGISSTPTVEVAVVSQKAQGGIIITASHNPGGWNALKLIDERGEFLSAAEGEQILVLAENNQAVYVAEDRIGSYFFSPYLEWDHIDKIMALPLIDREAVAGRDFKIVVDGINSAGGKAIPHVLESLGITKISLLNCLPNGLFAHKPEPLAENLTEIMERVKSEKADLGIVVDPDVDRLAFIDENGEMFGEEYTLVAIADYILENFAVINDLYSGQYQKATVSNLSSSRALRDITEKHGGIYEAAAVGEVNVVKKMKDVKSVIGGEGNGGIIFPALHYGRDAMLGVALFLSMLAQSNKKMSEIRKSLPEYFMVKDKLELTPEINVSEILQKIKTDYAEEKITDIDGVKIDWSDSWVHLRASNTEPIIRIYAEARTKTEAGAKVDEIKAKILAYIK